MAISSWLGIASSYLINHINTPENRQKFQESVSNSINRENARITNIFRRILQYPIKIMASFVFAPFLMCKVLIQVKSPIRRTIALFGLLLAVIATYCIGTWLGKTSCFWFIYHTIGLWTGIGFLIGSFFSMMLTVIICSIIFNAICFAFLKMNTEEVINYLDKIS